MSPSSLSPDMRNADDDVSESASKNQCTGRLHSITSPKGDLLGAVGTEHVMEAGAVLTCLAACQNIHEGGLPGSRHTNKGGEDSGLECSADLIQQLQHVLTTLLLLVCHLLQRESEHIWYMTVRNASYGGESESAQGIRICEC